MDYFLENTAPIWAAGALLQTMALIVFFHTRSTASMLAIAVVLMLVGAGLLTERFIVTPREEVEGAVSELLARIEANDLPGVLADMSSKQTSMAADAQTLMPMFDIRKARSTGEVVVSFDHSAQPPTATAGFKFFADVIHLNTGTKGGYWDDVSIEFVREGDQWKVSGYSTDKDWRKDASRL